MKCIMCNKQSGSKQERRNQLQMEIEEKIYKYITEV